MTNGGVEKGHEFEETLNIFVLIWFRNCMLNKNVADYTNFDGKTNKKIVQAPGGSSSISFAWSDEKTDYGPERRIRK